jgi:hypothetical protein
MQTSRTWSERFKFMEAQEYRSFLVRLWLEAGVAGAESAQWRGEVEHIQSGQARQFESLNALLDFFGTLAVAAEFQVQVRVLSQRTSEGA